MRWDSKTLELPPQTRRGVEVVRELRGFYDARSYSLNFELTPPEVPMLAMTYRGPKNVKLDRKPDPAIEHPNDIILQVTRAAICGSDLHLFHGLIPDTRVGCTFGHEVTGIVEEVGPSVQNLKRGDRVVVPFNISCGTCFFCSRNLFGNCENSNPNASIASGVLGYSHTTGGFDGGQAEYVRVPYADIGPMKIPDGLDYEDVLFLSDIMPTGYQAAEMGEIKEGETVVVFGAGPVGIFAAKSAWLMGAGRVIVVDHLEYRLAFVRRYAQVETLNFKETQDPIMAIKKMTDGRGADVCIDAVGLEADGNFLQTLTGMKLKLQAGAGTAIMWAIESVRKGGNVVIIGVYGPPWNLVPMGTAMNKGITIRMNQCNTRRYMPKLLDHIRQGHINPTEVISHRIPLEEVRYAYHIFEKKLDGCIKAVLVPPQAQRGLIH